MYKCICLPARLALEICQVVLLVNAELQRTHTDIAAEARIERDFQLTHALFTLRHTRLKPFKLFVRPFCVFF